MFRRISFLLFSKAFRKDGLQGLSNVRSYQMQCRTSVAQGNPCEAIALSSVQNYRGDPIHSQLPVQIPGVKSLVDKILDLPFEPTVVIGDSLPKESTVIQDPGDVIEKQAARMIVIRRRKMKRHRLKKLRLRMRFVWAKVRQRREMRKEKAFQAELMGQIKEARLFNAQAYAASKLSKAEEVLVPTRWRGKLYPDFIIEQLMTRKENNAKTKAERQLRSQEVDKDPSRYKY